MHAIFLAGPFCRSKLLGLLISPYFTTIFRKLREAEIELKSSSFADDVFHCLRDSLNALSAGGISEILCYGLGRFSCQRSSKYQLALLLSLKDRYGSRVYVYDPVFSSKEIELLKRFGFNIIKNNEEGKRVVREDLTLVYMPHCSLHLTNNFLYANWSKNLSRCILLTNSFQAVADNLIKTSTFAPVEYILRIQPHVAEIALRNSFACEEAFNDLNIHIFLKRDMNALPQSFWNRGEESLYENAVVDYFTAVQTGEVDVKNCNYISSFPLHTSLIVHQNAKATPLNVFPLEYNHFYVNE